MSKHENDGACQHCITIIFRYQDPYGPLIDWFMETQKMLPELHVSECGRGKKRQNALKEAGKSRASWGMSAHNWNCALDLFRNVNGKLYDEDWFRGVFAKMIPAWINWYGRPGSKFFELPHVEPFNWRDLIDSHGLELVEKDKQDERP